MISLKQKIKETTLFDDNDKIAVLAAMDLYSADDLNSLKNIIDDFDHEYKLSVTEYKKSINMVLDKVVKQSKPSDISKMQSSATMIRTGIDTILAS